ncbi:LOW QUALITY PROTEIN: hypothetical protein CRUP_031667 [Coryphaenoides rupestris]|nr:LOW QUALITY PROTEIN: hypothetical protein CRUP_031667 [Coryphaenoides rupestris]
MDWEEEDEEEEKSQYQSVSTSQSSSDVFTHILPAGDWTVSVVASWRRFSFTSSCSSSSGVSASSQSVIIIIIIITFLLLITTSRCSFLFLLLLLRGVDGASSTSSSITSAAARALIRCLVCAMKAATSSSPSSVTSLHLVAALPCVYLEEEPAIAAGHRESVRRRLRSVSVPVVKPLRTSIPACRGVKAPASESRSGFTSAGSSDAFRGGGRTLFSQSSTLVFLSFSIAGLRFRQPERPNSSSLVFLSSFSSSSSSGFFFLYSVLRLLSSKIFFFSLDPTSEPRPATEPNPVSLPDALEAAPPADRIDSALLLVVAAEPRASRRDTLSSSVPRADSTLGAPPTDPAREGGGRLISLCFCMMVSDTTLAIQFWMLARLTMGSPPGPWTVGTGRMGGTIGVPGDRCTDCVGRAPPRDCDTDDMTDDLPLSMDMVSSLGATLGPVTPAPAQKADSGTVPPLTQLSASQPHMDWLSSKFLRERSRISSRRCRRLTAAESSPRLISTISSLFSSPFHVWYAVRLTSSKAGVRTSSLSPLAPETVLFVSSSPSFLFHPNWILLTRQRSSGLSFSLFLWQKLYMEPVSESRLFMSSSIFFLPPAPPPPPFASPRTSAAPVLSLLSSTSFPGGRLLLDLPQSLLPQLLDAADAALEGGRLGRCFSRSFMARTSSLSATLSRSPSSRAALSSSTPSLFNCASHQSSLWYRSFRFCHSRIMLPTPSSSSSSWPGPLPSPPMPPSFPGRSSNSSWPSEVLWVPEGGPRFCGPLRRAAAALDATLLMTLLITLAASSSSSIMMECAFTPIMLRSSSSPSSRSVSSSSSSSTTASPKMRARARASITEHWLRVSSSSSRSSISASLSSRSCLRKPSLGLTARFLRTAVRASRMLMCWKIIR